MAEYRSFKLVVSTKLEDANATAIVRFEDAESGYKDELSSEICLKELDRVGGAYIDNIVEFLLNEAIDKLIDQKKAYRETIMNVYDEK